jgi:hypothetical protein
MTIAKCSAFLFALIFLSSCWKFSDRRTGPGSPPIIPTEKVWGFKPIYGSDSAAKKIVYTAAPRAVVSPGNIYAFQNYIFQLDPGLGIHIIDNTTPSAASRIGFITVKGCSQISIKDNKLYTNSYDDLVVLDFTNLNNIQEFSRLRAVFTEYRYGSPISSPPSSGYYACPRYDSLVVGWTRDSIYRTGCYKF